MNSNIKITLTRNDGYSWTSNGSAWVKGYGFVNDKLYRDNELLSYFDNVKDIDQALQLIKALDGFFSVVILLPNGIFAAVDHLRSMPLFYKISNGEIVLSDSLNKDSIKESESDFVSEELYKTSLFLVGDKTLLKDCYQICAGCSVFIDNKGYVQHHCYWNYKYDNAARISEIHFGIETIDSAYEETFKRLITILDNRTAVIPLSGGHDSRLILFYLKHLGYKNIITYTYGYKDNEESAISKKIANFFGVPHYFVEHKRSSTIRFFKKHFRNYALYSGNCVSVPCTQEWYAIKWLLDKEIIDKQNCVIIPGYSGDFLAGSHLISDFLGSKPYNKQYVIENIIKKHFSESRWKETNSSVIHLLSNAIASIDYIKVLPDTLPAYQAAEVSERFNLMERQAKFIENAVRAYEFWEFEWATPLFDKIQFDAWLKISNELRLDRKLFFEYEEKLYNSNLKKIPFANHNQRPNKKSKIAKHLNRFKIIIPQKGHYLNSLIPLKKYYISFLIKRQTGVNEFVREEYLSIVNSIIKK